MMMGTLLSICVLVSIFFPLRGFSFVCACLLPEREEREEDEVGWLMRWDGDMNDDAGQSYVASASFLLSVFFFSADRLSRRQFRCMTVLCGGSSFGWYQQNNDLFLSSPFILQFFSTCRKALVPPFVHVP